MIKVLFICPNVVWVQVDGMILDDNRIGDVIENWDRLRPVLFQLYHLCSNFFNCIIYFLILSK